MSSSRHAENLAAALEGAIRTAQAAEVQNARAIERLGPARVAFLRALAAALEPALPVLIDRGQDGKRIDGRTGLWIDRTGGFWLGDYKPEPYRVLTDAEIAELRIDPERIVMDLAERLESHAAGLERSSEKLERVRRRLQSIATLLEA